MTVLALDLASTSGWACGEPGGVPSHGSEKFGGTSSHEATFAKAFLWMTKKLVFLNPATVVWEAPLAGTFKFGRTNSSTTTILYGLPAVVGAAAYMRGVYDIRKAETRDVRLHFIGSNPRRDEAKKMTIAQCHRLGWPVSDDNEADALAVWSYMCSLMNPKLAVVPLPLFRGRR